MTVDSDTASPERPAVLFVDDEPAVLEALGRTLRKEPYEVLTAPSAAKALAILRSRAVDVVVSDQRMPQVSGSEFLAQVRQQFPDVVRMMLTGEANLDDAVRAINDGLYRFLSKPLGPDELARTLRQALHMKGVQVRGRPLTPKTPGAVFAPVPLARIGSR
jgi:DNA-binding NtrC family response regulator